MATIGGDAGFPPGDVSGSPGIESDRRAPHRTIRGDVEDKRVISLGLRSTSSPRPRTHRRRPRGLPVAREDPFMSEVFSNGIFPRWRMDSQVNGCNAEEGGAAGRDDKPVAHGLVTGATILVKDSSGLSSGARAGDRRRTAVARHEGAGGRRTGQADLGPRGLVAAHRNAPGALAASTWSSTERW
jgi:hypothetical protein